MTDDQVVEMIRTEQPTDEDIVLRVRDGQVLLFEILMRRHNQRIYRAIRSILRDDSECEDVMQEAYVRAYQHLAQFEGRARFSTWLTRIAVNEALKRVAARAKLEPLMREGDEQGGQGMSRIEGGQTTPESMASRKELTELLEKAILTLPDGYRAVVALRDIEEMSTAETAEALSLTEANVKVRLHRAHELLRDELMTMAGSAKAEAFLFHASRCDRVVKAVLSRLFPDSCSLA